MKLRLIGGVWWLAGALACAQAPTVPTVPTDHYGPPVCPGMHAQPHRATVESARAEQEQGAVLDGALLAAEPMENFELQRYRLAEYADCVGTGGCYWADLDAQYRRAEQALGAKLGQRKPIDKLAIVMDIDETTLSSYCEMRREDFGYIGSLFKAWVVSPDAAVAIPGAVRLFNEAKAAGVAVFFITGRPGTPEPSAATKAADQTAATAHNLEAAGFHGWTGLQLRNGLENGMTTIAYKSGERERIVARGYKVVLNVGDQWSDLLGAPQAEFSVKLPNPFYFLP